MEVVVSTTAAVFVHMTTVDIINRADGKFCITRTYIKEGGVWLCMNEEESPMSDHPEKQRIKV